MKRIRLIAGLVGAMGLCLLPLAAQQPGGAEAKPQEDGGIRVRGLSFQIREPIPTLYAHDPSKPEAPPQEVAVKTYLNHQASRLPNGSRSLVFTDKPDPASVRDEASVMAKVSMPKDLRSGILIFLPGTGAPKAPKYQILAVSDALRDFPKGSHKVLNLSPQTVRMTLENKVYEFKSGQEQVIEDPPVAANQSSGMKAFCQRGKDWQRIASGVLPHPGEKRTLQIFFENPRTKDVNLAGVRDVAVPE